MLSCAMRDNNGVRLARAKKASRMRLRSAADNRDDPPRGRQHRRSDACPAVPRYLDRNGARLPHSSRRSRGVRCSPCPSSAFASRWCDAAGPPASPGTGTGMKCSSATRCGGPSPKAGDCVIYAQCPLAARAALRARRGSHQRVVMAVHFRISQADEWVNMKQIRRDGRVFRAIRRSNER